VSGNDVGKAVLVKLFSEGAVPEVVMCVLRAPDRILLEEFACATGAHHAEILTEEDVQVCLPTNIKSAHYTRVPFASCHVSY
jgi:prolyl-tRNA editing enzyme YbaK/EbsC (Cys-tRNA(Pro) deacylase)